jgi:hypothetical protein
MRGFKKDRRNHRRWVIGGRLVARIARMYEAFLIDISAGGALVEHANHVQPGSFSFLSLSLSQQEVGLKCKVVRSVVHRYSVNRAGERDLIYRTGLEFLSPPTRMPATSRPLH